MRHPLGSIDFGKEIMHQAMALENPSDVSITKPKIIFML